MKVILIYASTWEQSQTTNEWVHKTWVCKLFHERDRPFAELWIKIHMEGFEWGKEHNTQICYCMDAGGIELNYV